ncbi:ATP phosphoribosyltransferase [Halodesulfurarchaeum formicicum]|uniref:ATP phosphoribosyltransferase n=1 Tax=Halodesulfurarchaeum formicicum TaxID=1873524 RepID=A0A1D8S1Y7_9EURY|nr:ATP phosphoribosyltransferase [Halodesulfurarchaeum formicicum]AOW79369.1 ATP phosphoribosyltransferase [Halodesulfurarchaeum formicicum]APE94631.1 ATP phosphoribosyltransferase [Halodesulfurarchaeum formicicum]
MRIAIPNKGRLHDPAVDLLDRAGIHVVDGEDRQLYADTVDPEITILFARAADIPEYIADGAADLGITGFDQAQEADCDVVKPLLDLEFGQCRIVVAAPEEGEITDIQDLNGKTVATEFPHITKKHFAAAGVDAEIVEVTGATELTPHVEMADAIVDITSTGTTLAVNRLAIIDEVLESSAHLFAHEDVLNDRKTSEIDRALESVLAAEDRRYLMLNAPAANLERIKEVIPGMGGPTVMDIADTDQVAIHAVVPESEVFRAVTRLKAEGATDILITEIERLVE